MHSHPYYPTDMAIPGYIPNEWDNITLVSIFSGVCTAIFLLAYICTKTTRPQIPTSDLWTLIWFTMCGFIHLVLEGYFIYNFRTISNKQDLLGQLWKEYSHADSRYQTQNAFVLRMETVTAVCWGPLSFLVAGMIATNNSFRYPLQAVISVGQLYGDVLYYATSAFDHLILGVSYSRLEAVYFWGYFVFLNAFWIVIPLVLLYNSFMATGRAFAALDREEKSRIGKKTL